MSREFEGKSALVTGASKGIGRAIAERLAREGCDVALAARNGDELHAVAQFIEAQHGTRAIPVPADLSSQQGCSDAASRVLDALGGLDIFVHCAGATKAGAFPDQSDEDWTNGFDLKFFGAVRLARALWPALKERHGTVVLIGGGAAYTPSAAFMVGGAVNAALAHFSKALSKQGLEDDVNVNIVHPGPTVTERMEALIEQEAKATGTSPDSIREESFTKAGIRRLGETSDVAEAVAFLCAPAARHIQGVGLRVDGGASPAL